MSTDDDIRTLAKEAAGWFYNATRADGSRYVTTKEGKPGWVETLVFDAHDDMLPDDWRYRCIRDALDYIAETEDDLDDASRDFAADYQALFLADLDDAIEKAKAEPAEAAHWAARDTITVDH